MSLLNGALFENYVSDVAVTMVVGLGYYLFKSFKTTKKAENLNTVKSSDAFDQFKSVTTLEELREKIEIEKSYIDPFSLLNFIPKLGFVPDITIYNSLLNNAFKEGNIETARLLNEEIMDVTGPVHPNENTLDCLIRGIYNNFKKSVQGKKITNEILKNFDEQLDLIVKKLGEREVYVNTKCLNSILNCFNDQSRFEETLKKFNEYKESVSGDQNTYVLILNALENSNLQENLGKINEVFEISKKLGFNQEVYRILMSVNLKMNKIDKVKALFQEVEKSTKQITESTYSVMVKAYGKIYKLDKCLEMLNKIRENGFTPSDSCLVSIINTSLRCRKIDVAERLLQELEKSNEMKDLSSIYFNFLNTYKTLKSFEKANSIFLKYIESDKCVQDNKYVFNTMLQLCVDLQKFSEFEKIYELLSKRNIVIDSTIYSVMLKSYIESNQESKVQDLYFNIRIYDHNIDEILYHSLLNYFIEKSNQDVSMQIYNDMRSKGLTINQNLYLSLLSLFEKTNNDNKAYELFDEISKSGIKPTEEMFKLLINLQMKSHLVDRAIPLFKNMLISKVTPSKSLCDLLINQCKEQKKDGEGFELLISITHEIFKLEDEIYESQIDNILKSTQFKVNEKVEFLSRLLVALKENNYQISISSFDRLSKYILQNKTLNRLSTFNESSIYSSAPTNTVIPNKYENEGHANGGRNPFVRQRNQYPQQGQNYNNGQSYYASHQKYQPQQNGSYYSNPNNGYNNNFSQSKSLYQTETPKLNFRRGENFSK